MLLASKLPIGVLKICVVGMVPLGKTQPMSGNLVSAVFC